MIKGGPKIETSGLQLYYDVDNIDSYPGEPTTNYCYTGGSWSGDGGAQAIGAKGSVEITDPNLMYNGYRTVLWTPGTSHNCYLNGSNDFDLSATSTQWAWSCYIKRDDGGTISSMSSYMYYPSSDGSGGCTVTPMGDRWYRISRLRTGTSNVLSLIGFTSMASEHKYYLSGWQLEKKTHLTQYADLSSTRSTTDGLKDLSGQANHADLATTTYDSNALIDYDGSSESVITSTADLAPGTGDFSASFWIYPRDWSGTWRAILVVKTTGGFWLGVGSGVFIVRAYSVGNLLSYSTLPTLNVWTNIGVSRIGTTLTLYYNGLPVQTATSAQDFVQAEAEVGSDGGSAGFDGKINTSQFYNQGLTSQEFLNNYNAIKSRFGH